MYLTSTTFLLRFSLSVIFVFVDIVKTCRTRTKGTQKMKTEKKKGGEKEEGSRGKRYVVEDTTPNLTSFFMKGEDVCETLSLCYNLR